MLRHYKLKETISSNLSHLKEFDKFIIKFKNDFINKEIKKEINSKLTFDVNKKRFLLDYKQMKLPLLSKKLEEILGILFNVL